MRAPHLVLCLLLAATPMALTYAGDPPVDRSGEPSESERVAPRVVAASSTLRPMLPSPEQRALLAIREEGQSRVRDLAWRIQSLPHGPERRKLIQQAAALKIEYRIRHLEARLAFARASENAAAAERIESVIERFLKPSLSVTPPVSKKPPGVLSEEGGRP